MHEIICPSPAMCAKALIIISHRRAFAFSLFRVVSVISNRLLYVAKTRGWSGIGEGTGFTRGPF